MALQYNILKKKKSFYLKCLFITILCAKMSSVYKPLRVEKKMKKDDVVKSSYNNLYTWTKNVGRKMLKMGKIQFLVRSEHLRPRANQTVEGNKGKGGWMEKEGFCNLSLTAGRRQSYKWNLFLI